MTKRIFLLILLSFSLAGFSQKTLENSFVIKNNKSGIAESKIRAAMLKASFEPYRDREKSVVLVFSNGFEVELLSANTLVAKGLSVDPASYEIRDVSLTKKDCTLTDSGYIMLAVSPATNAKYKTSKQ